MLKSYLTIALRNLRRHKAYTFINLTGLAIGMACCLLILLFVRDELSYDRFHEDADRLYRIVSEWSDFSAPSTNPPTVARLRTDFPQIEIAQLRPTSGLVRAVDQSFQEERMYFANPAVLDIFTFPLLRGDPETALAKPFTAILTEAVARKYFGEADPIGRTLRVDNEMEVEVTGIAAPVPANAHFHFDFLISWATLDALYDYSSSMNWGNNAIYTYLLLPEGYAPETLEAQFPAFIERHAGDNWNGATLSLQKVTDIHLHSHHNMELEPNSHIAYVYVFSIIAVFILLIACVNFMNLATARSAERAREVGVRKVVGARRRQLIQQFLAESVLLSCFALLLAVVLTVLALPAFRALSGKALDLSILDDGFTLLAFLLLTLLVGVLAGSYPAFFLSAFQPINVLKGRFRSSMRGALLRKGLVVFQFATSVCLIVGTAVVYNQLAYLRQAHLGFDKEHVIVLPTQSTHVTAQYQTFKEALLQQPHVLNVTVASEGLPSELLNGNGIRFEGAPEDASLPVRTVAVGHDFFETLGVEMQAGRSFSLDFPSDSGAFILNETALRLLTERMPGAPPSPQDAVGKPLHMGRQGQGPLIGVAEDFNMSSLHEAIEPVIFFINPNWYSHFLIRVRPAALPETVARVRDAWQRLFPEWPFAYRFADEAFDAQYRTEERLGQIFTAFSVLAILIACLGLFGLAAFTAQQRTKEIGVRKVLGATAGSIVVLLSRDFLRLVLLAVVLASPLAYFAMERWLEDFAYRIEIRPAVFLLAGGVALAIALLTTGYQAIRAAFANPVKALRYE